MTHPDASSCGSIPPREKEHVFGPVPSRRLGLSLGVDIVPFKICTQDCVYCQVGRTTGLEIERRVFVPAEIILSQVRARLATGPRPDHITLAGSGEPTLHSGLGDIIAGIKGFSDVPVAVLTNGSLLWREDVRRDCAKADVVLPSLDAGDEETFRAVNRPAPGITLERLVEGIAAFRREYAGQIWLEIFLIRGLNDSPDEARRIAALAERLRPDRIQLNTAVRPTADAGVRALSEEELNALRPLFGPQAEVIADFRQPGAPPAHRAAAAEILAMIRRRPVTLDDIASGMDLHRAEASKSLAELLEERLIVAERRGGREFYRAV